MLNDAAGTPTQDVQRLTQHLHDTVLQILVYMAHAGHGTLRSGADYQQLAADAELELRALLGEAPADGTTLADVISGITERVQRRTNTAVSVSVESAASMLEAAPFRDVICAVQEGLNNAVVHSRASHIHVEVGVSDADELCIRVGDDGQGFSTRTHVGRGLCQSLLEPAAAGRFNASITTRMGEGTVVEVSRAIASEGAAT